MPIKLAKLRDLHFNLNSFLLEWYSKINLWLFFHVIVITISKKFQQNILLFFWRNVNFLCKFDLFFFFEEGYSKSSIS
jgi:hypothetical protein